jgi:hypothetical protein
MSNLIFIIHFFAMLSASFNVLFAVLDSITSPPVTLGKLWIILFNI